MFGPLHLLGHLDFGDAVILNGLVRTLAEDENCIVWYVKSEYVPAVARMVFDAKNITVAPAGGGYEDPAASWLNPALRSLRLGYFSNRDFDRNRWDYEFYRQAGVPFRNRWDKFKLLHPDYRRPDRPFILLHEDDSRGFLINPDLLPQGATVIKVCPRDSILDWLPELFTAAQLHVIDSSFLNLIESLPGIRGRRVFHRYAKFYPCAAKWPQLLGPWEVIDRDPDYYEMAIDNDTW